MTQAGTLTATDSSTGERPSRFRRTLKAIGWIWLALVCLVFFTLLKLPEERIKNYIQGTLVSTLGAQGITLNASKSWLSIGFGLSYTMKDVTLSLSPTQPPMQMEQLTVSPSLLSIFIGRVGGTIQINHREGSLQASFSTSASALANMGAAAPKTAPKPGAPATASPAKSSTPISVSFKAKELDLGKMGLLAATSGIQGSAILTGKGELDGDLSIPSTLDGQLQLDFKKVRLGQQTIMGFSVPELNISEGKADLSIEKGKATIKTLNLGKAGNTADDLTGTASGDVTLAGTWDASKANLKTNFRLSQNLLKSLSLIDALLGPGKQADGSYSYLLTGPMSGPTFMPAPGGGK